MICDDRPGNLTEDDRTYAPLLLPHCRLAGPAASHRISRALARRRHRPDAWTATSGDPWDLDDDLAQMQQAIVRNRTIGWDGHQSGKVRHDLTFRLAPAAVKPSNLHQARHKSALRLRQIRLIEEWM